MSMHHEWLALVEISGPFLAVPVLLAILILFKNYPFSMGTIYFRNPFNFASFTQAVIPFLFTVLKAEVETFKVMNLPSSGRKNFLVIKFG